MATKIAEKRRKISSEILMGLQMDPKMSLLLEAASSPVLTLYIQ
jgi:hypothetical protein